MATGRVQLLSNHLVERLEMAPSGSKATGVVAVNQANGNRHLIHGDLVVLAASTIQSVSILLRSSEQYQQGGLVDPSGRLGTRLMDHVSTSQFFCLSRTKLRLPTTPHRSR
jgi:choline dehydrogenase-like flavoprotein